MNTAYFTEIQSSCKKHTGFFRGASPSFAHAHTDKAAQAETRKLSTLLLHNEEIRPNKNWGRSTHVFVTILYIKNDIGRYFRTFIVS